MTELRITPEAIEAFRAFMAACEAEPFDSDAYWVLHRALDAKPWMWPCAIHPDEEEAPGFRKDAAERQRAQRLWLALAKAAGK